MEAVGSSYKVANFSSVNRVLKGGWVAWSGEGPGGGE